jgi:hypothetical protein
MGFGGNGREGEEEKSGDGGGGARKVLAGKRAPKIKLEGENRGC